MVVCDYGGYMMGYHPINSWGYLHHFRKASHASGGKVLMCFVGLGCWFFGQGARLSAAEKKGRDDEKHLLLRVWESSLKIVLLIMFCLQSEWIHKQNRKTYLNPGITAITMGQREPIHYARIRPSESNLYLAMGHDSTFTMHLLHPIPISWS